MMLPQLVRCTNCGEIIKRGRKIKIRYKCYRCKNYVFIWNVREFYRYDKGRLVCVDYNDVRHRIELLKRMHFRK